MAERQSSLIERFYSKRTNPQTFEAVWGEHPKQIKLSKGPKCLIRDNQERDDRVEIRDGWEDLETETSPPTTPTTLTIRTTGQ
jgi:hypothetical protein